jgi:hypothetical protein
VTTDEAVQQFTAVVDAADADSLVSFLAAVVVRKGEMPERNRRAMIRTIALKLAIRVMQPGYLDDTNPDSQDRR